MGRAGVAIQLQPLFQLKPQAQNLGHHAMQTSDHPSLPLNAGAKTQERRRAALGQPPQRRERVRLSQQSGISLREFLAAPVAQPYENRQNEWPK